MLSLFRSENIILGILFIPYAILLRSYAWVRDVNTEYNNGSPLYEWFIDLLPLGQNHGVVWGLILVVVQALLLVYHTNQYKQSPSRSLLVGMIYILLMSLSTTFLYLNPVLLGNTFLILGMSQLFHVYRLKQPGGRHFNTGFWVALATLSYGSMSGFLIYAVLAMNVMRSSNLRESMQLLAGFAVPFILWGTYLYYTQASFRDIPDFLIESLGFIDIAAYPSPGDWVTLFMYVAFVLTCMLVYNSFIVRQGILTRKISNIVFIFLIFGMLTALWQNQVDISHLQILAIPISIFIGHLFHAANNKAWAEAWHLLFVVILLVAHWVL